MKKLQQLLLFSSCGILAMLIVTIACGEKQSVSEDSNQATLMAYVTSPNLKSALSRLDHDYKLYFGDRSGNGISKEDVALFLTWDHALHPSQTFTELKSFGDTITAIAHEENDFTRLIEFPGWDARVTYVFNDSHLIVEQFRVGIGETRSYKDWLKPALEWLRENRPDELEALYPDESLEHSTESAQKWVKLLTAWRDAVGKERLILGGK